MVLEVNGTAQVAEATTVKLGVAAALPGGVSIRIKSVIVSRDSFVPTDLPAQLESSRTAHHHSNSALSRI